MKRLLAAMPCLLLCLWLGCGTGEYERRLSQRPMNAPAAAATPAPAAANPAANQGPVVKALGGAPAPAANPAPAGK
jgi:hypothetical protein